MGDTKNNTKGEEVAQNTLKVLREERDKALALAEELQRIVPVETIIEGMLCKTINLSGSSPKELLEDEDTLMEFIEEAQAIVKTAKLIGKLLDKQ